MITSCRECQHQVSDQAIACPNCGAPFPARPAWDGFGWDYKSKLAIGDLPLVHVSFKYRANRRPVVARGIIGIGEFAVGVVCIAQFSIGLVSVSQFTLAGLAIAQFAAAYSLIAQFGLYISEGHGQLVFSLPRLVGLL